MDDLKGYKKRRVIMPHDTSDVYSILHHVPSYDALPARFKYAEDTDVKFINLWVYCGLGNPPRARPMVDLETALWNISNVLRALALPLHERIAYGAYLTNRWLDVRENDYIFETQVSPVKLRK